MTSALAYSWNIQNERSTLDAVVFESVSRHPQYHDAVIFMAILNDMWETLMKFKKKIPEIGYERH